MLGVAAMALFLSTTTDSPLSASLGALAFLIGSSLLLTIDAARPLQPYLPTRYWLSFVDLYRDPILWSNVERGIALQAVYVGVVLLGAAWANFTRRTSPAEGRRHELSPAQSAGPHVGIGPAPSACADDALHHAVGRQAAVAAPGVAGQTLCTRGAGHAVDRPPSSAVHDVVAVVHSERLGTPARQWLGVEPREQRAGGRELLARRSGTFPRPGCRARATSVPWSGEPEHDQPPHLPGAAVLGHPQPGDDATGRVADDVDRPALVRSRA